MRSAPLHDGTCSCDDGIHPDARGALSRCGLLGLVVLAVVGAAALALALWGGAR